MYLKNDFLVAHLSWAAHPAASLDLIETFLQRHLVVAQFFNVFLLGLIAHDRGAMCFLRV